MDLERSRAVLHFTRNGRNKRCIFFKNPLPHWTSEP